MRKMLSMFMVLPVLLGLATITQAGDEAMAIIDKAIAAHGLKDKDKVDKTNGYRGKNKGTLHVAGMDLEFTQEITLLTPTKFKEAMEITAMGNKIPVTTVFDGKQGWIKAGGMDIKVENELLTEFKDVVYMMGLSQGLFLKDKAIKYALLGELKVKNTPAVGIRVSKEGQKDISFYFDKDTGLIAKVERRARDFMTGQEVTEERIITEYQELLGRKIAKKVEVLRDGTPLLEAEVLEAQFVETIPDNEFAKPE